MSRPTVIRGPSARRTSQSGRRRATGQAHEGSGPGRGSPSEASTSAFPFVTPDGRVAVVVHAPKIAREAGKLSRDAYWRVRPRGWTELKETTCPTWNQAEAEARRLIATLTAGAGDRPRMLLRDAVAIYVRKRTQVMPGSRANRRRRNSHALVPWSVRYGAASAARLDEFTKELGSTECGRLTFARLSKFIAGRPTYSSELEMLKTVSACTKWLQQNLYVLPAQALHLQLAGYELRNPDPGGRLGNLFDSAIDAVAGESTWYVTDAEVPSHGLVHAAARAMPRKARSGADMWYLELLVLVAAYVGLRLGELLSLTCDDVIDVDRSARAGEPNHELVIEVRRQHIECKGAHIDNTKGRRSRPAIVPLLTPEARWPLTAQLRRRVKEARAERDAGTNPAGLLFPTTNGRSMFFRSNLRERYWYPAIAAADWPTATPEQLRRRVLREEAAAAPADTGLDGPRNTHYLWTFHSLRHVAARYWVFEVRDIDDQPLPLMTASQQLGHASTYLTESVYVGTRTRR